MPKISNYFNWIEKMKEIILDTISDMVTDLFYYNRKNDDELPIGEIEKLIKNGDITIDEMVNEFKNSILNMIKE